MLTLIRFWTAFHNCVESSLDNDIIPFAVPFLRKSASLTLLMNASCSILPSASGRTSACSGQLVKCNVNRHGSPTSDSSPGDWPRMSRPDACEGGVPEKRSWSKPRGYCHLSGTSSKENQPSYGITSGSMREGLKKAWRRGRRNGRYERR
jgi:hypothetical protein